MPREVDAPKARLSVSGPDASVRHRPDVRGCPHCSEKFGSDVWKGQMTDLVLRPFIHKSDAASAVSVCPVCHEPSWIHIRLSEIRKFSGYSEEMEEAARAEVDRRQVVAIRQWGSSLCISCTRLTSGRSDCSTFRTCGAGIGPVRTECEKYWKIGAPDPSPPAKPRRKRG